MSKDLTRKLEAMGPFSAPTTAEIRAARKAWFEFRLANGRKAAVPFMALGDSNTKTAKNDLPTITLNLSPADGSGTWNTCRWATQGCRKACLGTTAGRNTFADVQSGKVLRTMFLGEHPEHAVALMFAEVTAFAARHGRVACRLNVTSDLRWHLIAPDLFGIAGVSFYDYTKDWDRSFAGWHLTYSASERTDDAAIVDRVQSGANVAVAVDILPKSGRRPAGQLPTTWHGCKVTDGDVTDQRFGDEPGTVVLLRAKGAGQRDESGFVRSAV